MFLLLTLPTKSSEGGISGAGIFGAELRTWHVSVPSNGPNNQRHITGSLAYTPHCFVSCIVPDTANDRGVSGGLLALLNHVVSRLMRLVALVSNSPKRKFQIFYQVRFHICQCLVCYLWFGGRLGWCFWYKNITLSGIATVSDINHSTRSC